MSEPSFRITTEHCPTEQFSYLRWQARVVRLSDGEALTTCYGETEADSIGRAQRYLAAATGDTEPGHVMFASEDGAILAGDPRGSEVA